MAISDAPSGHLVVDRLIPGAVPQADFLRPDWGETQSSLSLQIYRSERDDSTFIRSATTESFLAHCICR